MWKLNEFIKCSGENKAEIEGQWVPARPLQYRTIQQKFVEAWCVFAGKADCFRWPGNQ